MFELKQLSEDAIPAALGKGVALPTAQRTAEAESICHDVLSVDPENQEALVILLLALTDLSAKATPRVPGRPRGSLTSR